MPTCAHCKTSLPITCYAMNRKGLATPLRCTRCGAVHSHVDGDVSLISPRVVPVTEGLRLSPWMLTRTRPLDIGEYHCRFRELEPEHLTLWWNGRHFQVSYTDTRAVRMGTFLTWRGSWA